MVVHFTLLIILQPLKYPEKKRIWKYCFHCPVLCVLQPFLLLKDTRLPKSHFIHVFKKPQSNRYRTGSGYCCLVHGVTFDFCNSHIWTNFPKYKLCVSLTQSKTFSVSNTSYNKRNISSKNFSTQSMQFKTRAVQRSSLHFQDGYWEKLQVAWSYHCPLSCLLPWRYNEENGFLVAQL